MAWTNRLGKSMRQVTCLGLATVGLAAVAVLLGGGYPGGGEARNLLAATAPGLGAAESFGVLAAAGVTNTGNTVLNGDLGTHPNPAITGFVGTAENDGPGVVNGTIHQADATALSARTALTTAYNNARDKTRTLSSAQSSAGRPWRPASSLPARSG